VYKELLLELPADWHRDLDWFAKYIFTNLELPEAEAALGELFPDDSGNQ